MMTIGQILEAANQLTPAQMLELNKHLCELIRNKRRATAAVVGTAFVPGMVVRFNAKTKGMKHIKIEKFNRAGTCVVGYECDASGNKVGFVKWTVANTICVKVA
jgi:hypothetical protein